MALKRLKSRTSPPRTSVRKQDEEDLFLDELETLTEFEQQTALELTDVLTSSLNRVANRATTQEFLDAIAAGNLAQANFVLSWADLAEAVDILQEILYAQMQAGAPLGLPSSSFGFRYQFDATNPRAIEWAREEAAARIAELTREQQGIVNQTIVDALANGYTVDDIQYIVSNTIGLHSRWARAVDTRYQQTLENLLAQGYPLQRAKNQARRLTSAYHSELLDKRGRMIARTEVLAAHNAGRWFTWEDAVAAGIAPTNALKKWVVRVPQQAGSPCEHCLPLNGVIIPWQEEFDGAVMMPPLHPNCVCTAVLVIPEEPEYLSV